MFLATAPVLAAWLVVIWPNPTFDDVPTACPILTAPFDIATPVPAVM